MKIDYKHELEQASKGMILIHDHKLLIKLIVRMIVRKLNIKHAAMLLYVPEKKTYVLSISRGETGIKVPAGYTRFNDDSPVIALFKKKEFKPLTTSRNAILSEDINKMIWKEGLLVNGKNGMKDLLHKIDEQMKMLNTVACVPAYYQDKLQAVLLLGEKQDGTKFDQDELNFFAALASDAAMAIRNAQLFEGLRAEAERNRKLFLQTILVLGSTIEAKDEYTHGHTERVTKYAMLIARHMNTNGSAEFSENFLENLYISGLLHDIGKIAVPEGILNKAGKLTPEEYLVMKQHTLRGAEIVKPLHLAKECVDGILYHHERFDGKGYPEGIKGANIPISAAIIAVADTLDAMTSDRPYRKGRSMADAVKEIESFVNTQFNPIPVRALVELHKGGKI